APRDRRAAVGRSAARSARHCGRRWRPMISGRSAVSGRANMKRLLVCLALLLLPGLAFAQMCVTVNCGQCFLQLFDDQAMTQVCGTIVPLQPKAIYLGLRLSSPETGFAGVEFSIAGMDGLVVLSREYPVSVPNVELGTPLAPPDTTGTATGGMIVAW